MALYKINNRRIAMRHRMHIGTIVSDPMMKVKFISGGFVGVIEEWFIARLQPGDNFTLAGRNLEFVMVKEMTALVRKSNAKKSIIPSWQGGRMPLSANLGFMLRKKFDEAGLLLHKKDKRNIVPEIRALQPLFELQEYFLIFQSKMNCLLNILKPKMVFIFLFFHLKEDWCMKPWLQY